MITKYICELCGEEFSDFHEALNHEADHVRPDNYLTKPLRYLSKDVDCVINDPRPYPLEIAVPMNDGALVQYTFDRVITPAPSPEPVRIIRYRAPEEAEEQVQPEVTE